MQVEGLSPNTCVITYLRDLLQNHPLTTIKQSCSLLFFRFFRDMAQKQSENHLRKTRRSLPIALLRARESVMDPIRAMLQKSGLTEQKWRVLRVLEEAGAMEQTRIASEACLLLPSLTRMLKSMDEDGLIERSKDAGDKRRTIVSITEAGRALINQHSAESSAIIEALESRVGKKQLEALLDTLEALQKP